MLIIVGKRKQYTFKQCLFIFFSLKKNEPKKIFWLFLFDALASSLPSIPIAPQESTLPPALLLAKVLYFGLLEFNFSFLIFILKKYRLRLNLFQITHYNQYRALFLNQLFQRKQVHRKCKRNNKPRQPNKRNISNHSISGFIRKDLKRTRS